MKKNMTILTQNEKTIRRNMYGNIHCTCGNLVYDDHVRMA